MVVTAAWGGEKMEAHGGSGRGRGLAVPPGRGLSSACPVFVRGHPHVVGGVSLSHRPNLLTGTTPIGLGAFRHGPVWPDERVYSPMESPQKKSTGVGDGRMRRLSGNRKRGQALVGACVVEGDGLSSNSGNTAGSTPATADDG